MSQYDQHIPFMERCVKLAQLGLGSTYPNPLVGAVIVHDSKIIGEGFHQKAGEAHAEVNAIQSVKDTSLLADSTIYVNLEPCAHHGRTPPCTSAIIEAGIPRVVVCNRDPNPAVSASKSILEEAGIDTTYGILEEQGRWLNRRFFTRLEKKRPYIILKWAETANGFMDIDRHNGEKGVFWITQPETKLLTHQWRAEEDAILVGAQTAINDNPSLTCREVEGKNPTRIILDPELKVSQDAKIFDNTATTIVANLTQESIDRTVQHWKLSEENFIRDLLNRLNGWEISSLIIEGGRQTLYSFIDAGLWDEARILRGKSALRAGITAPRVGGQLHKEFDFGVDHITILTNT